MEINKDQVSYIRILLTKRFEQLVKENDKELIDNELGEINCLQLTLAGSPPIYNRKVEYK